MANEKITINCGCCNGHSSKQGELWQTIIDKIRELWPDINTIGSHVGGWSSTEWYNDEVSFKFSVDSSD